MLYLFKTKRQLVINVLFLISIITGICFSYYLKIYIDSKDRMSESTRLRFEMNEKQGRDRDEEMHRLADNIENILTYIREHEKYSEDTHEKLLKIADDIYQGENNIKDIADTIVEKHQNLRERVAHLESEVKLLFIQLSLIQEQVEY